MANPLTDFKDNHHVIIGLALITVGVFGTIGSITGRLPAMIAGLFDPGDLMPVGGGSNSSLTTVESQVAGVNPTATGGSGAAAGGLINLLTGLGLP